jgi:hypothetical protein
MEDGVKDGAVVLFQALVPQDLSLVAEGTQGTFELVVDAAIKRLHDMAGVGGDCNGRDIIIFFTKGLVLISNSRQLGVIPELRIPTPTDKKFFGWKNLRFRNAFLSSIF